MRTSIERELKLAGPADFDLSVLEGDALAERSFVSTYFDTADRSLARSGITLRRRVEGSSSAWQLKLPRGGNARAEIESRGDEGLPAELASLLVAHTRHSPVEAVASLHTRRKGVRVVDGNRNVADVTVDQVRVRDVVRDADGFVELEIELVEGDEDDLASVANVLHRAGATRSDGRPKVFRALGIATPAAPATGAPLRELLQHELRRALVQLEAHDPGVRLGEEPEDLHKFRVATRRSRALIRATRPLLGDRLEQLGRDLRWLGGKLAPVRDLDVLIARLRTDIDELDVDRPGGTSLLRELEREREDDRAELVAALESPRYFRLLDDFAAAIALLPEIEGKVRPIARAELRRLQKASRTVRADATDEQFHALRIHAKRARYAAELAALTGRGKRLAAYIAAVTQIQDVIGDHQDAVVAEKRLRALGTGARGLAAGRLIEHARARRALARSRSDQVIATAIARGRAWA